MEEPINPATIKLKKVEEKDRQTLWNLLQYSLFEESATDGNHIQADGTFGYEYFDNYFTDDDRESYLVKLSSGELIGFVMINQHLQKTQGGHAIAEFLILPRFRRCGVGREVARRCFAMYPGNWEISPADGSESAYKFWKSVIGEITGANNQLNDGLFIFNTEEQG